MALFTVHCIHKVSGQPYSIPVHADTHDLALERAHDEGHLVATNQRPEEPTQMRRHVSAGILDAVRWLLIAGLLLYVIWSVLRGA